MTGGQPVSYCHGIVPFGDTLWVMGDIDNDGGWWRSDDRGVTFDAVDHPDTSWEIELVAVSAQQAFMLVLDNATDQNGSLVRTDNGGVSWTTQGALPGKTDTRATLLRLADGRLVVGRDGGLLFSDDDGKLWSSFDHGALDLGGRIYAGGGAVVLALAEDDSGLYRSRDGGESFSRIYENTTGLRTGLGAVHMVDGNLGFVYEAGRGLFRTEDGGDSWALVNLPNLNGYYPSVYSVQMAPDAKRGVLAADDGALGAISLLSTQDGGVTWVLDQVPDDFQSDTRVAGGFALGADGSGYACSITANAYPLLMLGAGGGGLAGAEGDGGVDASTPPAGASGDWADAGDASAAPGGGATGDGGSGGGCSAAPDAPPLAALWLVSALLVLAGVRHRRPHPKRAGQDV